VTQCRTEISALGSATVLHPKHNRILHHSAKGNAEKKKKKKQGAVVAAVVAAGGVAAAVVYIGGIYYMLYYIILYCSRIPVAVFVCFRIGFSAQRKKTHIGTFSVSFVQDGMPWSVCFFVFYANFTVILCVVIEIKNSLWQCGWLQRSMCIYMLYVL